MPVFLPKKDFLPFVGPNFCILSYFQPVLGLYNKNVSTFFFLFFSDKMSLVSLCTASGPSEGLTTYTCNVSVHPILLEIAVLLGILQTDRFQLILIQFVAVPWINLATSVVSICMLSLCA